MMVGMLPIAATEQDEFQCMAAKHFSELSSSFVQQEDWKEHYFAAIMANPLYILRWIVCDNVERVRQDRKSTRLNSSHTVISYAVFCFQKQKISSSISLFYARIADSVQKLS